MKDNVLDFESYTPYARIKARNKTKAAGFPTAMQTMRK